MRRLVVTENISLDGVISPMDGWFDPADSDEDITAVMSAHREAADALVLGRVTYQEFEGYWPRQVGSDPSGTAEYLDRVAKYVVSGTLTEPSWAHTTVLRGPIDDEVSALKQQDGADIVVTGSATLVRSLAPTGLVDEYRLFVYPVVQGHGTRLFPDSTSVALTLVDTQRFRSGVVLLTYSADESSRTRSDTT